jgi:hypothetical protein
MALLLISLTADSDDQLKSKYQMPSGGAGRGVYAQKSPSDRGVVKKKCCNSGKKQYLCCGFVMGNSGRRDDNPLKQFDASPQKSLPKRLLFFC